MFGWAFDDRRSQARQNWDADVLDTDSNEIAPSALPLANATVSEHQRIIEKTGQAETTEASLADGRGVDQSLSVAFHPL